MGVRVESGIGLGLGGSGGRWCCKVWERGEKNARRDATYIKKGKPSTVHIYEQAI
jgi:hypothetical protein